MQDARGPRQADWHVTDTGFFEVRSHLDASGKAFVEYTSHLRFGSWPLVHITFGRHPETGRRKVAKGIVALGRIAIGVVPIGQLALGLFPVGQAAVGLFCAIGQLAVGWTALGQAAIAVQFAAGQFAMAHSAIGQVAVGEYCLGQIALGEHIHTMRSKDPAVLEHFRRMLPVLRVLTAG